MDDWQLKPARDLDLTPKARHVSYRRESGLTSNLFRFGWWAGLRTFFALVNRMEVHGRDRIPGEPSFVLVANHASHLDALVLGATLPLRLRDQLFPLAAGDVFFETPVLARFSAVVLNALPVWRKNCGAHAIKDLRTRLVDEPSIFILFPEGARTRDGQMLKFRSGVGMMTAETPVPVIPCHLSGTFEAFPAASYIPRPYKIRIRIGEPRLFADIPNNRDGWDVISTTLQEDVRKLGTPAT